MEASKFATVDLVQDSERLNGLRLAAQRRAVDAKFKHLCHAAVHWVALAVSGAVVGLLGVVLTLSSTLLADLRLGKCGDQWYLSESLCCAGTEGCDAWKPHTGSTAFALYLALSVLFALAASFVVSELAPMAAGSGISEIKCIVSGFYLPSFLSPKVLAVKCLTLPLTIASGLSVGKEGPSVHYAACVGQQTFNYFKLERVYARRADLLTACCAAGVAVAFGSPIGGVLFGLEEISSRLTLATVWRSFFCCLVATFVVQLLNPFRNGQMVLFSVQYRASWHMFELPFFVLLGVFGGVVGNYIIKLNLKVCRLRRAFWKQYALREAAVLALITAVLCYGNEYLRVDMTRSMQLLFQECGHGGELHASCDVNQLWTTVASLLFAAGLRLLLLLWSYGAARVPAGIFVPSLAIGALVGRVVGTLVSAFGLEVNAGAYAVLGAGALLAGVMHITLTVVVVMFELTGAVHYIVPTMIVVGTTKLISSYLGGKGIADKAIEQNGYPFVELGESDAKLKLRDVMVPVEKCHTLSGVHYEQSPEWQFKTYPVVDEQGRLIGAYDGSALNRAPLTFHPNTLVSEVKEVFMRLGPHTVYAVEDGKFAGLLTRKQVAVHHKTEPFTETEKRVGQFVNKLLTGFDFLKGGGMWARGTHASSEHS